LVCPFCSLSRKPGVVRCSSADAIRKTVQVATGLRAAAATLR
jgi:hypothetical protein